jgi:hypothetical protein
LDTPEPGDIIYVDTDLYISHGEDDFRGGKATVSKVRMQGREGEQDPWVEVVENPGTWYCWPGLAEDQADLAINFGDRWAHPIADLRPEFNGWQL